MTPLQQLRIWLRRASAAERVTTMVAAVVALALFGWLVLPVRDSVTADAVRPFGNVGTTDSAEVGSVRPGEVGPGGATPGRADPGPGARGAGGIATGSIGSAGGAGAKTVGAGGKATRGAPGTGTTAAGGPDGAAQGTAQQCPAGGDQGVSASKIQVAVTLINIVGAFGNDALGVPSATEQQQDWQQVADSINAAGGAGCRQLSLNFYSVNPVDSNDTQSKCLQIAADKPFIAVDTGGLTNTGASDCIPAQKIPLVSAYVTEEQTRKYYPYYISPTGLRSKGYRSNFLGAQQKGYLSAASGFKKLGVFYQSCRPSMVAAGRAAIVQAGVSDRQTVAYDMGCPPGRFDSTADTQQAVLTFKNAGVTHVVVLDDGGGISAFSKAAAQQQYKPQYLLAEDAAVVPTSGPLAPDAANLDGALAVVGGRYGEQTTPGYTPGAATVRCNAIYAKHGQKPVYEQGAGYGGSVCNYLWFVTALIDHAPVLQRSALVAGMRAIGSFDSAFSYGPVDFTTFPAGTPYGLESWRVVQFRKDCACWQILDTTFHPPFA